MEPTPTLRDLFEEALTLPPHARASLLERQCRDPALRDELERMLAADAGEGDWLARGNAVSAAQAIGETDAEEPLPVGSRIGSFELLEVLGEGGSSTVFRAFREADGVRQYVALKLLARGLYTSEARRRFRHEREALARLRHPGIARLIEGGVADNGLAYIAMELIEGEPITRYASVHHLHQRQRLTLFLRVCRAVESAHRALIAHRDLKPSNVFVTLEGDVKLLDFGIARLLDDTEDVTRTRQHALTPAYAAPEQFIPGAITTATDVYALGVLLRELLTGERNASTDTQTRFPRIARSGSVPPHAPPASRMRGDLGNIVAKATAQEPERRYGSAGTLAEDIERYLDRLPVRAHPPSRWYRAGRFVARHRGGVAIATILLAAILVSSTVALWQAQAAHRQARIADGVRDFMVGVFAAADPEEYPGATPTARQLLDAGARRLTGKPVSGAEEAELAGALARSYAGIGTYKQALPLAERALQAFVRRDGERSDAALDARLDYASILQHLGRQQEARDQAHRVSALLHDAGSLTSARAQRISAEAAIQLGDYANAQKDVRNALAKAQALGAIDLQAQLWALLAQTALGSHDSIGAQRDLRNAAALFGRSRGVTAAQTLDARDELAFVLAHSGHIDEAVHMYAAEIADERRMLGPLHPRVAAALSDYAYLLWSAGRYVEARETAAEDRQLLAAITAMPVTQRSHCLTNLAFVAHASGDLVGALRSIRDMESLPQPQGADAPEYLGGEHVLHATIDAQRGDPSALAALQRAVVAHPPLLIADRLLLPSALLAQGRFQAALDSYRKLLAALTTPRRKAEYLANVRLGEGVALVGLHQYAPAQQALADALAACGGRAEQSVACTAARLWRGWAKARAGNPDAGMADIEAALAWYRAQFGGNSYLTGVAYLAHAEALAKMGRRENALRDQSQAHAIFAAQLLPEHMLRTRAKRPLPR